MAGCIGFLYIRSQQEGSRVNSKKYLLYGTITILFLAATVVGIMGLCPKEAVFYNVTFQDFDGTILKTELVQSGRAASALADPQREGYTFVGWNMDYSSIVKDTVITAEYLRITDTVFKVDTVTVGADNKNVEVKVSVVNNPGILGMVFSVIYDEETLKLIDCQNGVALSSLAFQEPSRLISGCNFVWYGSETGEVMDGEMLILIFEIAEGAEPGTYPISISWNDNAIYYSNSDIVDPDVTQGAIILEK